AVPSSSNTTATIVLRAAKAVAAATDSQLSDDFVFLEENTDSTAPLTRQSQSLDIESLLSPPDTNVVASPPTTNNSYIAENTDVILHCIALNSLSLENLVEAGELLYANKTLKDIAHELVKRLSDRKSTLPNFIQECLVPIMFLLKREQNLDHFMRLLTSTFKKAKLKTISTTFHLNLRTLLHSLDTFYFQQTIDIDFAYSFLPERPFNTADCHGELTIDLLNKIQSLFDGYLIHIRQSYLNKNSKVLTEYLKQLPKEKYCCIVVRDIVPASDTDELEREYETIINSELQSSDKRLICPLINLNINDTERQDIVDDLREKILASSSERISMLIPKEQHQSDLQKLLNTNYVDYLNKMKDIITPLKQCILDKDLDNQQNQNNNIPLYLKFVKLCKLRQQLRKIDFYGSGSGKVFVVSAEILTLENESNPAPGKVFELFCEILQNEHKLMSLNLLSAELKQELKGQGSEKLAGNLTVANSFQSLEVLWRNAIVCYENTSVEIQKLILESYLQYVSAGFPFELIDGDQFYFHYKFLTNVMAHFRHKRILVISVLGPQNSGKSTLLNYMFGTLFEVREGRCSRGIYGSLVKCKNIPDIDYILLIDTEGLLSIEKNDREYDLCLVLFCLAVSHLVIVNILGDINETIKDMLTLCADSLKQLNADTVPKPAIHFILNQKADPNIKNHEEAINMIITDLKQKDLGGMIDIRTDTFHALPSAFKKERLSDNTNTPCFLRTEPDFIEKTQELVSEITDSAKKCYDRTDIANLTPPQWISRSITIFDIIQTNPDLTSFKNLDEKRLHEKIQKQTGDLVLKTFSSEYRLKLIEQYGKEREEDIKQLFQSKFQQHQEVLSKELEDIFNFEYASDRIRKRCQEFLESQITETKNAWCIATIQTSDQKQMELFVRNGEAEFRNLIDTIIQEGRIMTKENATANFEEMWQNKIASIKSKFIPDKRLEQAIKFVYGHYSIFERKFLQSAQSMITTLPFITSVTMSQHTEWEAYRFDLSNHFNNEVLKLNAHERLRDLETSPSKFTSLSVENFVYLNKQILEERYFALCGKHLHSTEAISVQSDVTDETASDVSPMIVRNTITTTMPAVLHHNTILMPGFPATTTSSNEPEKQYNLVQKIKKAKLTTKFQSSKPTGKLLDIRFRTDIKSTIKDELDKHPDDGVMHPIENDLIQKIVCLINTITDEINIELSVFELSLSRPLIARIHINVLQLLIVLHFKEQQDHFHKQLEILDREKTSILTSFISCTVPDVSCDKESGELFVSKILDAISRNLTDKAQIIIANILRQEEKLSRKELQVICDGKLQQSDDEWLLKYIEQPIDIIVDEFKIRWEAIEQLIQQQLISEKNLQKLILDQFFHYIRRLSIALYNEGSAVKFITDIFEASAGTAAENLKNKGQCMTYLLYAWFTNKPIQLNMPFTVCNSTYKLTAKGVNYFQNLTKPQSALANLMEFVSKLDLTFFGKNQVRVTSIKNFSLFLTSITDIENRAMEQYNSIPTTFESYDKDQSYIKLLDKARGCKVKCPCCSRPCDADHALIRSRPGAQDNKHCCKSGHQLRAFAGIRFEQTNEASLYQCNKIDDTDLIVVKVTTTPHDADALRTKFLFVWGKIGRKFCDKFKMEFIHHNRPRVRGEAYHYILLLDSSPSMSGDRWTSLIAGVKALISARIASGTDDRVTIITFASKVKLFCVNEKMKDVDTTKITLSGWGTNFSPAFQSVIDTIENAAKARNNLSTSSSKYIIVFMSDGETSYPETEINGLQLMKGDIIREFWTVALGKGQVEVLKQINTKMGGTYKQLDDPTELIQVYAEIAQG
ncbi:unnamed protein product, partial [Didymodactylos carnosus]